jgi:malonate decarboxylase delta subunit
VACTNLPSNSEVGKGYTLERLEFSFSNKEVLHNKKNWAVAGVASSGNLEVLIESVALDGLCKVVVKTSVAGFGVIWQKVLEDFFKSNPISDILVSINDSGASPAVVSLRLEQALQEFLEGTV